MRIAETYHWEYEDWQAEHIVIEDLSYSANDFPPGCYVFERERRTNDTG